MLFQVFTNLLDNAIKFTPEHGNIAIDAQQVYINQSKQLKVIVSDTGKGIPKEERNKVLQPFYRLEKHRNQPGNGLGLSLVSAIINLHNGSIFFEDNSPGLKVSIYLPL